MVSLLVEKLAIQQRASDTDRRARRLAEGVATVLQIDPAHRVLIHILGADIARNSLEALAIWISRQIAEGADEESLSVTALCRTLRIVIDRAVGDSL